MKNKANEAVLNLSPWLRGKHGFLKGMGSVMSLFGGYYTEDFDIVTPWWVRDAEAIRRDWENVGDDFRKVMGELEIARKS